MEYLPHIVSVFALVIALFFRGPKQEIDEVRRDLKRLWEAHNTLAVQYAGSNGTHVEQAKSQQRETELLRKALEDLTAEVRALRSEWHNHARK